MHALGNPKPHMAILSGTGEVTRSMQSSVDAAELTTLAKMGALRGAIVDGPLVFDNEVSLEAANIKGIISPVAGNADILLVPNLESGNFLFKQMVNFMSATAAGIIMGAKAPIILTSRADPAKPDRLLERARPATVRPLTRQFKIIVNAPRFSSVSHIKTITLVFQALGDQRPH